MKKIKNLGIIIISVGMALILAFTLTVNILALGMFDNLFEQFIGKTDDTLRGDTLGADVQYIKSAFSSPKELYEFEEGVCAEIAQEGITLLKNEDSTLPLKKGTTLSLFSHSSVDLVSGGSGSGSGSFELTKNLREGLEHAGLKVNDRLWNFYSVGAMWNIKAEPFMQSATWLDNLQLKLSYGTMGNSGIDNYLAYGLTNSGLIYDGMVSWYLGSLSNQDLTWETLENLNVGVNATFFRRMGTDGCY